MDDLGIPKGFHPMPEDRLPFPASDTASLYKHHFSEICFITQYRRSYADI